MSSPSPDPPDGGTAGLDASNASTKEGEPIQVKSPPAIVPTLPPSSAGVPFVLPSYDVREPNEPRETRPRRTRRRMYAGRSARAMALFAVLAALSALATYLGADDSDPALGAGPGGSERRRWAFGDDGADRRLSPQDGAGADVTPGEGTADRLLADDASEESDPSATQQQIPEVSQERSHNRRAGRASYQYGNHYTGHVPDESESRQQQIDVVFKERSHNRRAGRPSYQYGKHYTGHVPDESASSHNVSSESVSSESAPSAKQQRNAAFQNRPHNRRAGRPSYQYGKHYQGHVSSDESAPSETQQQQEASPIASLVSKFFSLFGSHSE